jgi:CHAT domain-containing protein
VQKAPTDPRLEEAQQAFDEGRSLKEAGRYAAAVPLAERALTLRETALTGAHSKVADCLSLLGEIYLMRADHARAEPLLARALEIRRAALGEAHPSVAESLNDLARLYELQELYERAEPLLARALEIREATLGQNHSEVANSLARLGDLYVNQGFPERAASLYARSLRIHKALLHKNRSDDVGIPLTCLAWNCVLFGGPWARLQEDFDGSDHPAIATLFNNLANLYNEQGVYARAEHLYARALRIRESTLDETHPDVAQSLNDIARFRLAQRNLGAALPLLERAFELSEQHLRQEVFGFSEKNLANFLELLRSQEERLYALARAHPRDTRVLHLALSAALLRKGRSAQEVANTSQIISQNLSRADREAFERLRALRTQLATLSLAGPGRRSPADYQQRLKELAAEGDLLEADLSRRSAPLRALTALPSAANVVDLVARALPKDGALVELIAYEDKPLVPKPGRLDSRARGELRYLALVLFPDSRIRALDLGPAAVIDPAASSLRAALARKDATFEAFAQTFYGLAFRPLQPLLGNTRRLIVSPDGELSLVPFAALHDGRQFLVDSFDFSYVTSGRDLLPRFEVPIPSNSVVVLADPSFNAQPPAPSLARADAPGLVERSMSVEDFLSTLRADLAEQPWVPLPGTRREAETLQRLIPRAQLFLGSEATKERLLRLSTPGVLHIATHGFFLEDVPAIQDSRAVGHFGALGNGALAQMPDDPLLRSGLALTQAGTSAPVSSGTPTSDPALITALELMGLNLWGTELVVLSACDTGRGDIKLGQGVYGLRRALVVAGAETVVMSLWKVNDDTTRMLMEAYYGNLLAGQGRASALREAMRMLRVSQPHPHFWAPFISLGRDAPLRAIRPTR